MKKTLTGAIAAVLVCFSSVLFAAEPSFIVDAPDNTINDQGYTPKYCSYDGFVITDNKLNKLKTKPPVVFEKDDKGIISIILELENPNLKLNFNYSGNKLFVGGNTSIPNRAHDLQRKFGTPELEQTDCLTGYVKLSVY